MNLFTVIKNYFLGVYEETKKVNWPTRTQTLKNTLNIVVAIIVLTVVFGLIDYGLSSLVTFLLTRR
ncbi:MAG: preprotein translocase subunit SecE [Patescibacteria group bacterium]|nr:preprotein translocase subunit SecE [Patescibacteria group bacterium]